MFCPSGNFVSNTLALTPNAALNADALREKPALVLSLLEEMVDFGYPQVRAKRSGTSNRQQLRIPPSLPLSLSLTLTLTLTHTQCSVREAKRTGRAQ